MLTRSVHVSGEINRLFNVCDPVHKMSLL